MFRIYVVKSYVMLCVFGTICCNLKNVKNTHGGVLLLVNIQAESCAFTKSNSPPRVLHVFKLKMVPNYAKRLICMFYIFS